MFSNDPELLVGESLSLPRCSFPCGLCICGFCNKNTAILVTFCAFGMGVGLAGTFEKQIYKQLDEQS